MNEQAHKQSGSGDSSERGLRIEYMLKDAEAASVYAVREAMRTASLGDVEMYSVSQKWNSARRKYEAGIFTYRIAASASGLLTFITLYEEAGNFTAGLSDLPLYEARDRIEDRIKEAAKQIKEGTFVPAPPPSSKAT